MHVEIRPETLTGKLKPAKHKDRVGGSCGHHKVVLAKPRRCSIIIGNPVFAQHKDRIIFDRQFSKMRWYRRGSETQQSLSPEYRFCQRGASQIRLKHVSFGLRGLHCRASLFLARANHCARSQFTCFNSVGIHGLGPFVAGCRAIGAEIFAARTACKGTDRNGCVGQTKDRRTRFRDRFADIP